MKKLLGSALALALVFPSGPASAELLKNLKVSGGLDFQAISARNVADFSTRPDVTGGASNNDRVGTAHTRVWASLWWDLLDDVHAKVTLRKNNRAWGTAAAAGGQQAGDSESVGTTGGGGVQANVFVNEAFVKIDKLMGSMDATLGRQFLGEPGDLIAFWGPKNTFGLPVTAIDALSVMASNDWMNFMGMAGKVTGTGIPASGSGAIAPAADLDVRGIDVGWKGLPVKVNTFLWNRVTHATGGLGVPPAAGSTTGLNDFLWVYGAKLRGEAMGGWANLTVAANAGQNRTQGAIAAGGGCGATACPAQSASYLGRAVMLDLGYKMDVSDVGGFTPWFTWGWGSGRQNGNEAHNEQFQSISSDFRPGVIYGRFNTAGNLALGGNLNDAGSFTGYDGATGVSAPGLGNRIIWGGGLKFNCARWNKLTTGLSFWDFNYQYATVAGGAAAPTAVGNRHIGSEFDVQLDWAHSENVTVSGGVATFQPGGFIKETVRAKAPGTQEGVNPVTMLFADLNLRF